MSIESTEERANKALTEELVELRKTVNVLKRKFEEVQTVVGKHNVQLEELQQFAEDIEKETKEGYEREPDDEDYDSDFVVPDDEVDLDDFELDEDEDTEMHTPVEEPPKKKKKVIILEDDDDVTPGSPMNRDAPTQEIFNKPVGVIIKEEPRDMDNKKNGTNLKFVEPKVVTKVRLPPKIIKSAN